MPLNDRRIVTVNSYATLFIKVLIFTTWVLEPLEYTITKRLRILFGQLKFCCYFSIHSFDTFGSSIIIYFRVFT